MVDIANTKDEERAEKEYLAKTAVRKVSVMRNGHPCEPCPHFLIPECSLAAMLAPPN